LQRASVSKEETRHDPCTSSDRFERQKPYFHTEGVSPLDLHENLTIISYIEGGTNWHIHILLGLKFLNIQF